MKKFFIKLLIFLLPLIVVFSFLEFKIRNINSYYMQKRDGLISQRDSVQILILGTSHAMDGVAPDFFRLPAFNMAFGSQSLINDKDILCKFLPELKGLKYVLISIDYHSFYFLKDKSRDFFYHHYYGIEEDKFYKGDLSQFFFVYTPTIALKLLNTENEILVNGWDVNDTIDLSKMTEEYAKIRVDTWNQQAKERQKNKPILVAALQEMITKLKESNIIPVLITLPCSEKFNKYADTSILRNNTSMVDRLVRKNNIRYLNYLQDKNFVESDFFDADHLNKRGAIKFTKILNDDLFNKK